MTKKLRERAIVEAFLRSNLVPGASLEEWDGEWPDAMIRVGERLIGVEVTTLTEATRRQPTAPQKWTVEAGRVVEAARITFESSNSQPLVVSFQFRPDWDAISRWAQRNISPGVAQHRSIIFPRI